MERTVYQYGAGKFPPLMVGRDQLLRAWDRMLDEVSLAPPAGGRNSAHDMLLTGPRGVGKTCLMTAFAERARTEARGYEVLNLQAVRGTPTLVGSLIRQANDAISSDRGPWQRARAAFERFAGVQLGVGGLNAGISTHPPTPQLQARDPESLAAALSELAQAVRAASSQRAGGVMIAIDELQAGDPTELSLLAATLQRLNVDHPNSPVVFAATGLPHTTQHLIAAGVTHPDRLFAEKRIPLQLELDDARAAVVEPARAIGVAWDPYAVDMVVQAANSYPAHLQFFAGAVWEAAQGVRVEQADAVRAIPAAIADLTIRSLDPRWEDMTPRETELITAIAVAGGRATVGQLEAILGRPQSKWSRTRADLIEAGEVYAPRRGVLEIAVPALARYATRHYEEVQRDSDVALVDLATMIAAGPPALPPNGATGQLPPGSQAP